MTTFLIIFLGGYGKRVLDMHQGGKGVEEREEEVGELISFPVVSDSFCCIFSDFVAQVYEYF